MTYPVTIYVDASGRIYGAKDTDQAYTSAPTSTRTVNGRHVEWIGTWYGSQMSYRPFKDSVQSASKRAELRDLRSDCREFVDGLTAEQRSNWIKLLEIHV
jgi:hypothetical protein